MELQKQNLSRKINSKDKWPTENCTYITDKILISLHMINTDEGKMANSLTWYSELNSTNNIHCGSLETFDGVLG